VPCCCTTGTAALVVSISLGMTSNVLLLAAFQFQFDRFFEPTLIVASGRTPAELLRRAAVLDLFGYYLATAVRAYVLWRQLRPRNRLIADLSTMAALSYALAGGVARPSSPWARADADAQLHRCHGRKSGADRGPQFATVLQVVWRAIGQFLDAILLAAWWLGIWQRLHSRGRRQRRGARSATRRSARRALVARAGPYRRAVESKINKRSAQRVSHNGLMHRICAFTCRRRIPQVSRGSGIGHPVTSAFWRAASRNPRPCDGYNARRCATSGQRNGSLPRSPTLLRYRMMTP
jgi:hypothetical protein